MTRHEFLGQAFGLSDLASCQLRQFKAFFSVNKKRSAKVTVIEIAMT